MHDIFLQNPKYQNSPNGVRERTYGPITWALNLHSDPLRGTHFGVHMMIFKLLIMNLIHLDV